jgi:hypothetical protein
MYDAPNGTFSESVYEWLDWLKECGQFIVFCIKNVYHYTNCKFYMWEDIFQSIVKNKLGFTVLMGQIRLEESNIHRIKNSL